MSPAFLLLILYNIATDLASGLVEKIDLEDLIALRNPELTINRPSFDRMFNKDSIEKVLMQFANALNRCTFDVLRGDFSIFSEIKKIQDER